MMRLWPSIAAFALSLGSHAPGAAQDAKPPQGQKTQLDHSYENDPCGNPSMESGVWLSVTGRVVKVTAGDRLVIDVPKAHGHKARRGVAIRLAGIEAPAPPTPFGRESRQRLESLALGRVVSVMTQMGVAFESTLPGEIVGVARLNDTALDLSLEQVRAGMARHEAAAPYTMSNYRECRYRIADREARAARRGLWRQGGVTR